MTIAPITLTQAESDACRNEQVYVAGVFRQSPNLIFRGLTPHGWPLVHLENDPPYFGTLTAQGERGNRVLEAVKKQAQLWLGQNKQLRRRQVKEVKP